MAKHRGSLTKKLKKITVLDEFKKFILRGNVIDLAVGVIIGGAFNKIVTSLVNDVVMPLLSIVIGQNSFATLFIALDGKQYASVEAAGAAPLLKYGNFLSTVLDFILMGLVIFILVKGLNFFYDKVTKDKPAETPPAEPPAPEAPVAAPATTKACPYCISQIHIEATVCPCCTSRLDETGGTKSV